ncbi:hypothetical protein AAE478_001028 [Parahypoxylon ruwenzoriense]
MILCGLVLPNLTTGQNQVDADNPRNRLARIDFLGAAFLGSGLLALLLPLRIAGQEVPWTSSVVLSSFALGAILLALFVITESRWAKEPIFPLRLLKNRDVVFSYFITLCQSAAQLGMMVSVPLYFQVTERSSSTVAGAHLMPAVIGNTIGALLTGAWIRSGFGTGISMNAGFVALQAAIDPVDKAVAASGLFLCMPLGSILGMAGSNAMLRAVMPADLASRLRDLGIEGTEAQKIIKQAVARVDYLDEAPERVSRAVVQSYVYSLEYSHGVSLFFAILATSAALLMSGRKLNN